MRSLFIVILALTLTSMVVGQVQLEYDVKKYLPENYRIFDQVYGDLNKDGMDDCVIIIKGTDKDKIIKDEYRGELDLNRRGLIILFQKNNSYKLVLKNHQCFASEDEDGGIYFAPELSVVIKNGNLCFHFSHGRYGYWEYIFKFKNSDFELIGYNAADRNYSIDDWVTFDEISINFLTKKKLIKKVVKVDNNGREIYKEIWRDISYNKSIKLSEVEDFDTFDIEQMYKEK